MLNSARITLLIFISVFVSSITFFTTPFEGYLHYIIFLILLPSFYARFGIPKTPLKLLFIPCVLGILQIYSGNNTWAGFMKIFIGVLLSASFYQYVLMHYEFKTDKIFSYYMKGAYIVSIIGIVEVISYYIGFTPGYDYKWLFNKWGIVQNSSGGIRMNSIFSEASQCAIMIAPASFVVIYNIIFRKNHFIHTQKGLIILLATLLTTSSTGFIGFFITGLLIIINYAKISNFIGAAILFIALGSLLYGNVLEVKLRVDSGLGLWIDEDFSRDNVNSSSFVLYNNYHIALENFKDNPIAGTGLGSHSVAFEKYSLTKQAGILNIDFNKSDANSMFLRLLSETGLIGILFILGFIFRFYVIRSKIHPESNHWIVGSAVLVIIILYLLRQGNYFINGFPIFMWIYYYNYVDFQNKYIKKEAALAVEPITEKVSE
jgi:hypothetical protein